MSTDCARLRRSMVDFTFTFVTCFSEYLATFKKTVAMHEVFLQRMAAHPILRTDVNFKVFLEYEPEVLPLFHRIIIAQLIFMHLFCSSFGCTD